MNQRSNSQILDDHWGEGGKTPASNLPAVIRNRRGERPGSLITMSFKMAIFFLPLYTRRSSEDHTARGYPPRRWKTHAVHMRITLGEQLAFVVGQPCRPVRKKKTKSSSSVYSTLTAAKIIIFVRHRGANMSGTTHR